MLSRFRQASQRAAIAGVELAAADVRHLDTLPVAWQDYDLIVSVAMLEYLPKAAGTLVVFVSRQNVLMVPFITKWWHAQLYGKTELRAAFQQAGFPDVVFERFPFPYSYLHAWGQLVVARS